MTDNTLWQTKLAARVHDPAEKALVLLHDPAGHESGTSRALARLHGLGDPTAATIDPDNAQALANVLFQHGLPSAIYRHVQRADCWAAAADCPQWPLQNITVTSKCGEEKALAIAAWAQTRWTEAPLLIHPLTGKSYNLAQHGGLAACDFKNIRQRGCAHFSKLVVKLGADDAPPDWRKTLLAFWRFGPELAVTATDTNDNGKLDAPWALLPADTRVPDHSIWDHLDLTSAFACAFAADPNGEAALLALSIGPVQGFIAAARSTSDLWAGSHLLSRLAWEAMRPLCEALGPDAILFPRLRGIPQVDLWLRDQMDLPDKLFAQCEWMHGASDANPLFSAALPNRFVAVVPASRAREIAEQATQAVREWLKKLGDNVVMRLLHEAGFDKETTQTPYMQMKEQLAGFPEVHWAAVPFSLIRCGDEAKPRELDTSALSAAMAPFFGVAPGIPSGFLDTRAWQVLHEGINWGDGTTFFAPNPGVLYPAVYDLAERVMAAAKSAHAFEQTQQQGWRCSLTGESEWLTCERTHLSVPAGKRRSRKDPRGFRENEHIETLWTKVADAKPAWAKRGEHLGALPAIKRLWPTIFAEEVGRTLHPGNDGPIKDIGRFVVSTHTMALAHQLEQWLIRVENGGGQVDTVDAQAVALPRKLMLKRHTNRAALETARRLPGLLDADDDNDAARQTATRQVRQILAQSSTGKAEVKLETYYALLMMDGDKMGAILSGDKKTAISYHASFHPQLQEGFDEQAASQPRIQQYGNQKRPISPGRHLAISGALNDFSQTVVRHVVESEYLGRVIYAGGDDVLAMLPVADLLPCMQRLRHAYSGVDPEHAGGVDSELTLSHGFAALKTRRGGQARLHLMRMMGANATASTGAVIAHHQAPLGAVMRELRAAEKRAKTEGGRNAFSISVIKRSGGALRLTGKWGEPLTVLGELREFLAADGTSRRAVYHTLKWLTDLPAPNGKPDMLESLLAYQLARQSRGEATKSVPALAKRLAALAAAQQSGSLKWLENFLTVAEFLAREGRASQMSVKAAEVAA